MKNIINNNQVLATVTLSQVGHTYMHTVSTQIKCLGITYKKIRL